MSTLFLVATPIGNLEDVTLRALRTLREVSLIAAEDTRRTAKLLAHYDIHTPTTSFYDEVEREKTPRLLARLTGGEDIALVSDAGTPGISDPGYRLVKAAIAAGVRVEAVPGPSSVLAALVSSGLPTHAFSFVGFPPPKVQARDRWLEGLAGRAETQVMFEAPHRVAATLSAMLRILGDRPIVLARELTKQHEDLVRGPISLVLANLASVRGEMTLVVGGFQGDSAGTTSMPDDAAVLADFCQLTDVMGVDRKPAMARLASRYGVTSRDVYAAIVRAKRAAEVGPDPEGRRGK